MRWVVLLVVWLAVGIACLTNIPCSWDSAPTSAERSRRRALGEEVMEPWIPRQSSVDVLDLMALQMQDNSSIRELRVE